MEKPDYGALDLLLVYGANPMQVTLQEGDTPLHAALTIGLAKDKGDTTTSANTTTTTTTTTTAGGLLS